MTVNTFLKQTAGNIADLGVQGVTELDVPIVVAATSVSSALLTGTIINSGTKAYTGPGAETIFTAVVNSVYIVATQPKNYGTTDDRWGTWLVSAIGAANTITITSLSVGSVLGGGATPTLANTGMAIKLTNGSGTPSCNVNWIRLI